MAAESPTYIGTFTVWGEEGIAFYSSYGLTYPVTPCCEATAKGTEWGICCRACYEAVDGFYGMSWTESEWARMVTSGQAKQEVIR